MRIKVPLFLQMPMTSYRKFKAISLGETTSIDGYFLLIAVADNEMCDYAADCQCQGSNANLSIDSGRVEGGRGPDSGVGL